MPPTTRLTYRHLPHWEVEHGRYFVTVRCADSLPRDAVQRLAEIARALGAIAPRSPQFAKLQRESFHTLEKYLDAGLGACPLQIPEAAQRVADQLVDLRDWQCEVPHYSIMPNHWHAIIAPSRTNTRSLSEIMKRLKGRTAKGVRAVVGGSGDFWQREWFDRWIRDDAEWGKIVHYIRQNPVKAGSVARWEDHLWTR